MTRAEHIQWCKERAREYLDAGDVPSAVASMLSDLGKHPETASMARTMGPIGLFAATRGIGEARKFIEGFNE